ncbi:MFS transporter [Shewanella surugensis]|uniref:MFS transporter n=1 Tax=Shewanella surugensis TaxID=212020 RepID=A0ABT0LD67_9GAMM|nr:MFS transporter [Shewanella surugensis]MCL1125648.1 MFS transporter [Shewanella surugensis]
MKNKQHIILYIPMCLMLSYWGYMKVALPIIPDLLTSFHTTQTLLHQFISLAFILSGLSSIFWGVLIDRFEIKYFLISVTCIGIVTLSLISISTNVWFWGLSYIIGAIIMGGLIVCSRSFVMIYLTEEADIKKALTMPMMAGFSAAFFTPYISGWLASVIGWNYAFFIIPLWLILLLSLLTKLPPSPQTVNKNSRFIDNIKAMLQHLKNKTFLFNILGIACVSSISQSYYIAIIFWLMPNYNIPIQNLALYLFPLLFPGMIIPLFIQKIYRKIGEKQMIILYITLLFTAAFIAFYLNATFSIAKQANSWLWVIPGVLCSISLVCLAPILSFRALSTVKEHYNSASGLLTIAVYSAGGVGIYITSFITLNHFYLEGIFILITTILLILCMNKSQGAGTIRT